MITELSFENIVKTYFSFLTDEFSYKTKDIANNGNLFYEIIYECFSNIISISYESYQDYLLVKLYVLKDGKMPDYDDSNYSFRLNELNKKVFPFIDNVEIIENNEFFSRYQALNDFEKELLKSAKELRLYLKYNSFV